MLFYKFFVVLFCCSMAWGGMNDILDLETINLEESSEFVTPCILKLLEKYFKSERAIKGSLAIVSLTKLPSTIERAVVKIMNEDEEHKLGLMVKDGYKFHYSPAHVTEKAANYFLLLSTFEELVPNLKLLYRLPTFNPLANVVVLFTNIASEEYFETESMRIFDEFFRYSMYNVNIMSQRNGTIQSVTYFPYEGENCATAVKDVKLIDECFNEKLNADDEDVLKIESYHKYLYPKIPRKFHGCKLNVSAFLNAPYAGLGDNGEIVRGLEILMLQQISRELSFTLSYTTLPPELVNSLVTPNATDGIYSNIMKGISDVMVGGFHENAISRRVLSSSIPFYQDDLTWCVPPADLASNLTNAFGIFNWFTWLLTFFILLATGLIILAYAHREHRNENVFWSLIMSLGFTLGNPSHFFPNRTMAQVFLCFLMFYGMHFNVFYHSFLITVMTRPKYQPQVANTYMAIYEGFTFYGSEDLLAHFQSKGNDTVSKTIIENYEICKDLDKCLGLIKTNKRAAVAVSRHHADNNPTVSRAQMFCFKKKDNIFTYSVSMLTKKQYHLLDKIDRLVRTISESGLLQKWELESSNAVSEEEVSDSSEGPHETAIKLKIEHVQAGFLLLGVGSVLGTFLLMLEWGFYLAGKKYSTGNFYVRFDKLFC